MEKARFEHYVKRFERAQDQQGQPLNIHYLYYQDAQKILGHDFKQDASASDIRSISKTVMALVLGIAIQDQVQFEDEVLSPETRIYPIIKNRVKLENRDNLPFLQEVKIEHLLNHTIGYDQALLMRDDIKDKDPFSYLDYLINYPLVHPAGSHYLYSNAGFYLLAVVLQEVLQEDLYGYIDRKLFQVLGIDQPKWEYYGNYIASATRLWLRPEDLLKIGQVLLNDGLYQGQEIVSSKWLDYLKSFSNTTPEVDQPQRLFRRYAYAKGLWLAKDEGIFFGHGTDGQTLILIPKKKAILLTLSQQTDVHKLEAILDEMIQEL